MKFLSNFINIFLEGKYDIILTISNQEPIIITFQSIMDELIKHYVSQLDKWCKTKGDDFTDYFQVFYKSIEHFSDICICFDNRIVQAIEKLTKNFQYIEFSELPQHRSAYKTKLKEVIKILGRNQFISRYDEITLIQRLEKSNMKKCIEKFLGLIPDIKKRENIDINHQIMHLWKKTINMNFVETWSYLAKNKIYESIVLELYEQTYPVIKSYNVQKIQEITQYRNLIKKHLKEVNVNSLVLDLFPSHNPEKKMQYSKIIDDFITKKSLFLNKYKYDKACQQIKDIVSVIKHGSSSNCVFLFELFGSMRTGFALIDDSDGDIEFKPQGAVQDMPRGEKCNFLDEVYNILRNNKQVLNYSTLSRYKSDTVRNPFLKLKFQNNNGNFKYALKSIDLTINIPNAVKNSKVLELYNSSDYIIKFCNLIKYWAIRKTLINTKIPTEGFSSYGVVLMTLFYLIKAHQAPYVVQKNGVYQLEKNLLDEDKYLSLYDNFIGFLEFYKYKGRFFTEGMIVCLKQKFTQTKYSSKYLVNMHDFIDDYNPGRMTARYAEKFFNIIQKTYIQLVGQESIQDIMKFEQFAF